MVTTKDIKEILAKLQPLLNKKAWGVSLGVGSFITMEFGSPIPVSNQKGRVHGKWHLWIYDCAWRLDEGNTVLVASEDERSKIERMIQRIEGRILTSVVVVPPALETSFDFENKIVLRLFPIYTENVEHWMLFTPEKKVLVIGPGTSWSYEDSSSK